MDENAEVPEITTECWSILGIKPQEIMCSNSRMIVKRKEVVEHWYNDRVLLIYKFCPMIAETQREILNLNYGLMVFLRRMLKNGSKIRNMTLMDIMLK
jgi:hypothetical protein